MPRVVGDWRAMSDNTGLRKRQRDGQVVERVAKRRRQIREKCPCARECLEFLQGLGLDFSLLDEDHDRCYCSKCSAADRLPPTLSVAGELYEIPHGFCGFGIKLPARAESLQIFDSWHVSFHGLASSALTSVLFESGLLLPGDQLLDGSLLKASTLGDPSHLFTSPSVLYSEKEIYTKPVRIGDKVAKVVLQCRQKPGYDVIAETIGWEKQNPGKQISPHFPNSVLERRTRSRASVIPYRVLVKLEDPPLVIPSHGLGHVMSFGKEHVVVSWPDFGECKVSRSTLKKCQPHEVLAVGDAVRLKCDILTSNGTKVPSGKLGVVRDLPQAERVLVAFENPPGMVLMGDAQISKCRPKEFIGEGDIVRVTKTCLSRDGNQLRSGSLCTISALEGNKDVMIEVPNLGLCVVDDANVSKCSSKEFLRHGDVVKILRDLALTDGSALKCGQLGAFVAESTDMLTVECDGKQYEMRNSELRKCATHEFWKVGDCVVPTKELVVPASDVMHRFAEADL